MNSQVPYQRMDSGEVNDLIETIRRERQMEEAEQSAKLSRKGGVHTRQATTAAASDSQPGGSTQQVDP